VSFMYTRVLSGLAGLAWFLLALALPPAVGAQTVTATLIVGESPQVVAVNPVTNKIYVANWLSDNVSVIDGQATASPPWRLERTPTRLQ
jgi:hypothetical protein